MKKTKDQLILELQDGVDYATTRLENHLKKIQQLESNIKDFQMIQNEFDEFKNTTMYMSRVLYELRGAVSSCKFIDDSPNEKIPIYGLTRESIFGEQRYVNKEPSNENSGSRFQIATRIEHIIQNIERLLRK